MSCTSVFWLQPRHLSVQTLVFSIWQNVCLLYWSQIRLPRFQLYLEIEYQRKYLPSIEVLGRQIDTGRSLWVQVQPDLYSESQVNQGYIVRPIGSVVFKFAVFILLSVKISCGVIRMCFQWCWRLSLGLLSMLDKHCQLPYTQTSFPCFVSFGFVFEAASHCSPGCPGTHYSPDSWSSWLSIWNAGITKPSSLKSHHLGLLHSWLFSRRHSYEVIRGHTGRWLISPPPPFATFL